MRSKKVVGKFFISSKLKLLWKIRNAIQKLQNSFIGTKINRILGGTTWEVKTLFKKVKKKRKKIATATSLLFSKISDKGGIWRERMDSLKITCVAIYFIVQKSYCQASISWIKEVMTLFKKDKKKRKKLRQTPPFFFRKSVRMALSFK